MIQSYSLKVILFRFIFLVLTCICVLLYSYDLTDYIILIAIIVLFLGLFSISETEVILQEVKIRKNYFWAIFSLRKNLSFDQIVSIRKKEYEIDTHEDAWLLTEGFYDFFIFEFLKPKTKWVTSILFYMDKGVKKGIELKIAKEDYWDIERRLPKDLPPNPYSIFK